MQDNYAYIVLRYDKIFNDWMHLDKLKSKYYAWFKRKDDLIEKQSGSLWRNHHSFQIISLNNVASGCIFTIQIFDKKQFSSK